MGTIGETDYRNGARERLEEAFVLLKQEHLAGSIYLAGRAVEGMLRAMIWKSDVGFRTGKSLETGHDLRALLTLVQDLGVLRFHNVREQLAADIMKVGRLWSNNMRFWPTTKVDRDWREKGETNPKRTLKRAAKEYCDACLAIIVRCEKIWQE